MRSTTKNASFRSGPTARRRGRHRPAAVGGTGAALGGNAARPWAAAARIPRRQPSAPRANASTPSDARRRARRRSGLSAAPSSAVSGSARAARFVHLTRGGCLSAARVARVASSAARPRGEQRRVVGAQHRPPRPARCGAGALRGTSPGVETLRRATGGANALRHAARCCRPVLPPTAAHGRPRPRTAAHCRAPPRTAAHCRALPPTAARRWAATERCVFRRGTHSNAENASFRSGPRERGDGRRAAACGGASSGSLRAGLRATLRPAPEHHNAAGNGARAVRGRRAGGQPRSAAGPAPARRARRPTVTPRRAERSSCSSRSSRSERSEFCGGAGPASIARHPRAAGASTGAAPACGPRTFARANLARGTARCTARGTARRASE